MKRKKIGLALGGGGARGYAHIGVIKTLVENNIPIDIIAGTSVGAMIGGLYATLGDIAKVEEITGRINFWEGLKRYVDPVWEEGFIKGEKIEQGMRDLVGKTRIEDLPIKFGAVATDLNTAEVVLIEKGDMARAVRASASIPLLFAPVKIGERNLVDGGLSCPVPVEQVKQMGADVVIGVNLDSAYFLPENRMKGKMSAMNVLKNSLFLLKYHLAITEVREADIVINPKIPYVMEFEFSRQKEIIEGGRETTRELIEQIRAELA